MRKLTTAALAAALTLPLVSGTANAAAFTFGFDVETVGGWTDAGTFQSLRFTYDEGDEDGIQANPTLSFSGSVDLDQSQGTIDGGWFVLSPGGDPKEGVADELAILYMDFGSGLVSAYQYDAGLGIDGYRSFEDQSLFIASYEDAIQSTITDGLLSFSIDTLDVSAIQSATDAAGYTGVAFGEEIGIWLHLTALREFEADENGVVTSFEYGVQSFFDLPSAGTDGLGEVPLPGAAVFALTGLVGLIGVRKARG